MLITHFLLVSLWHAVTHVHSFVCNRAANQNQRKASGPWDVTGSNLGDYEQMITLTMVKKTTLRPKTC